jgi:small subunit ribosomal protein S2
MPVATRRELLEAGVHFGHQTRRWNPKMHRFIFGERSGIYIIDLEKTLSGLNTAYQFLVDVGRRNGTVLFVGTKKQAQETVAEQADRVSMPFVNTRWLGGMLTNFQTIHGRLKRLKELREMDRSGAFEFLPKKEVLKLRHEKEKLERNLSGIQDMERLPHAVFVVDTKREHIAVKEARKLGIPVVAIVDTNCDPDEVDYVVPGNDDAIRSCSLITKVVADAIQEGQYLAYQGMQARAAEPEFEREPAPVVPFEHEPEEARTPITLSEEEAAFFGRSLDEGGEQAGQTGQAGDGEEATPEAVPAGGRQIEVAPAWSAPREGGEEHSRTHQDMAGPVEPEAIEAELASVPLEVDAPETKPVPSDPATPPREQRDHTAPEGHDDRSAAEPDADQPAGEHTEEAGEEREASE